MTVAAIPYAPPSTCASQLAASEAQHEVTWIVASIREVGLVEPTVVARNPQAPGAYLLLDGHLRVEALKDLGKSDVQTWRGQETKLAFAQPPGWLHSAATCESPTFTPSTLGTN